MSRPVKMLGVRIPVEVHTALKMEAVKRGVSLQALAWEILERAVTPEEVDWRGELAVGTAKPSKAIDSVLDHLGDVVPGREDPLNPLADAVSHQEKRSNSPEKPEKAPKTPEKPSETGKSAFKSLSKSDQVSGSWRKG